MAFHPDHQRLPYEEGYGFGGAFIIDRYCPLLEAAIPITDCGFMHADAVYDVVSVSRGAFFRLEQHQDRFARAREAIRVRSPYTREEEAEILHKIVALAGLRDAYVWWTVTRGAPPLGRAEMVDPDRFESRFYAFACPFVFIADDEQRTRGLDLIVSRDRIRISPRAVDPKAKNFHWLDMQMALFEAGDRGAECGRSPRRGGLPDGGRRCEHLRHRGRSRPHPRRRLPRGNHPPERLRAVLRARHPLEGHAHSRRRASRRPGGLPHRRRRGASCRCAPSTANS